MPEIRAFLVDTGESMETDMNKTAKPTLVFLIGATALAGCSGEDPLNPPQLIVATSFADHSANDMALKAWVDALDVVPTPIADIPASDSASYTGTLIFSNATADFGADLSMTANYGGNSILGTADNVIEGDDTSWSGALDFNGVIDRGAAGPAPIPLDGVFSGVLSDGVETATVTGDFFGGFVGEDAAGMGVFIDGTWVVPGSLSEMVDGEGYAAR